jgi:hypothetical protein
MTDETMRDVAHTHPYTGETFGAAFRRGPPVTDGGRSRDPDAAADVDPESDAGPTAGATDAASMADVDHTPVHGDGARGVWDRGADEATGAAADEVAVATDGTDVDETGPDSDPDAVSVEGGHDE